MTKLMEHAYNSYLLSNTTELYQCYSRYSVNKIKAFNRCKELMNKMNGHGLKILGHNCNTFSVGFEYENENGVCCFAYITRDYDRFCEL